jgi:hypothetical protein
MPSVGARCHELRTPDESVSWRIIYRIDADATVIADVLQKKSVKTPKHVIETLPRQAAQVPHKPPFQEGRSGAANLLGPRYQRLSGDGRARRRHTHLVLDRHSRGIRSEDSSSLADGEAQPHPMSANVLNGFLTPSGVPEGQSRASGAAESGMLYEVPRHLNRRSEIFIPDRFRPESL